MAEGETKKRALSGSVWTLVGYGGSQLIRLGGNLVLAHLLFPAAFGVMALVSVVMQGIQFFSDIGVGPSIIQNRRGYDPDFLNTAWTMQVIRGFIIWIVASLLAWPAAQFFGKNDPLAHQLLYILPVVGFTAVIGGFFSTSVYLLNRRLQFAWLTLLDLIPQFFTTLTMIILAWIHPSIWALVEGGFAGFIVHLILSHWVNLPLRNRFRWDPSALHDLLRFGTWIFLGTMVSYFTANLDRIIIGKLLSLKELGLYSIALTFARFPLEICGRLSTYVLFPILSRMRDEPSILVAQSLKARNLILLGGGAGALCFGIAAPVFFKHLYDPRYAGAGEISQWLSIFVWFNILLISMEKIPLALGHPRALFVSNLVTTAGYGIGILGFWWNGLHGFILGLCFSYVAAHLVLLSWIPERRSAMLTQSVLFTLCFVIFSSLADLWLRWSSINTPPSWAITTALLTAITPFAAAGIFILSQLRKTKS